MLTQPLLQQLHELRLRGMAAALRAATHYAQPPTSLNVRGAARPPDPARAHRAQSCRLAPATALGQAHPERGALRISISRPPRGLDRAALGQVTDLGWIREHLNVLITGPTGVGKSFHRLCVGHAACRADHSVRFFRLPAPHR